MTLRAFCFGVHGAGAVVVGQDHPEVLCGTVFIAALFIAALQLVDAGVGDRAGVFVVGLPGDALVAEGRGSLIPTRAAAA